LLCLKIELKNIENLAEFETLSARSDLYCALPYLLHMHGQTECVWIDEQPAFFVFEKKVGPFRYLTLPTGIQKNGTFCTSIPTEAIAWLQQKYFKIHLSFSENLVTNLSELLPNVLTVQRSNFVLSTKDPYEKIQLTFDQNHKRNVKKAQKNELILKQSGNYSALLTDFIRNNSKNKSSIAFYQKLFKSPESLKPTWWFASHSKHKEFLAGIFSLELGNRLYILFTHVTQLGKEKNALFFLIDQIIQQKANQDFYIDFEGSNEPGLARFYKGFGSHNEPYLHYSASKFRLF
jgi:hypothetical protein